MCNARVRLRCVTALISVCARFVNHPGGRDGGKPAYTLRVPTFTCSVNFV